jgi:xylulokinase
VLDATARLLGVDHATLSELAVAAPPGAGGLVLVPYLEGERTPDRPNATGSLHGLTLSSAQPASLARAAVEGLLCGLADGLDALRQLGVPVSRALLVGGGAKSRAVQHLAADVLGVPVVVPAPQEYVARGAARQAAWVLSRAAEPPQWPLDVLATHEPSGSPSTVRSAYAERRATWVPRR